MELSTSRTGQGRERTRCRQTSVYYEGGNRNLADEHALLNRSDDRHSRSERKHAEASIPGLHAAALLAKTVDRAPRQKSGS